MADDTKKKLILKRDQPIEIECTTCTGTGYVDSEEDEDGEVEEEECAFCDGAGYVEDDQYVDPAENAAAAKTFLKNIIRDAGFTPKIDDYDDTYALVWIKEFGGECYLQVEANYQDLAVVDDEVEVDTVVLVSDHWNSTLEQEFSSYEDAVKQLPLHLNQYVGCLRKMTKGEAKKNKAA